MRNLATDAIGMEASGNYWYYPTFLVPMEVGSADQELYFLLNTNWNGETTIIADPNTGNCTVPNPFDYAAGGVTLGTAGTMTMRNSWEYFLYEFETST